MHWEWMPVCAHAYACACTPVCVGVFMCLVESKCGNRAGLASPTYCVFTLGEEWAHSSSILSLLRLNSFILTVSLSLFLSLSGAPMPDCISLFSSYPCAFPWPPLLLDRKTLDRPIKQLFTAGGVVSSTQSESTKILFRINNAWLWHALLGLSLSGEEFRGSNGTREGSGKVRDDVIVVCWRDLDEVMRRMEYVRTILLDLSSLKRNNRRRKSWLCKRQWKTYNHSQQSSENSEWVTGAKAHS